MVLLFDSILKWMVVIRSRDVPSSHHFGSNAQFDTTSLGQHISLPWNSLQDTLNILNESKYRFLDTVRDKVQAYVRSQDSGNCLSVVELQRLHSTDGSIIEQGIGTYRFSLWTLPFGRTFVRFVSATNGLRPQYRGNTLDSRLYSPIRDQVLNEFKELYAKNMKQITGRSQLFRVFFSPAGR